MKTEQFQEGDQSKAFCSDCAGLVATTFQRRDVPLSNGRGIVEQVLAAVCNQCNAVVATPAQSTPAIKKVVGDS